MRLLKRYLYFILAGVTYMIVHEGVHIIQALIHGIYEGVNVLPIGIEVEITKPLTIDGFKLAAFSGLSSVITLLIGYLLYLFTPKVLRLRQQKLKNYLYYVTLIFLLLDPVYISILSIFVGGDINGIVLGLNLEPMFIRSIYFVIAVINGYFVSKKLYPAYMIKTVK